MLHQLFNDESGLIISAELVLVLTIGVLATIVGIAEVAVAINTELNDVSNAIGALNQSYAYSGFASTQTKLVAFFAGTQFLDGVDNCDFNTSCDIVCGAASVSAGEGVSTSF